MASAGSPVRAPRPILRMPSTSEGIAAGSFVSPLTQVKHGLVDLDIASTAPITTRRNPVAAPPLDFNLFRSNSVYSVESLASLESSSSWNSDSEEVQELQRQWAENAALRAERRFEEEVDRTGDKTPTTPRSKTPWAINTGAGRIPTGEAPTPTVTSPGYFDLGPVVVTPTKSPLSQPVAGPSRGSPPHDGQVTPTKAFFVKNRPGPSLPIRSMSASQPSLRSPTHHKPISPPGSGPYALHHAQSLPPRSASMSATAAPAVPTSHWLPQHHVAVIGDIPDQASIHGEQGSDWGEDEQQFEWVDTSGTQHAENGTSPSKRPLARLRAKVPSMRTADGSGRNKLKKPLVFPRRAAPPPPPGPGSPREGIPSPILPIAFHSSPSPPKMQLSLPSPKQRKAPPPPLTQQSSNTAHPQLPVMVALKDGEESLNKPSRSNSSSRNSAMSLQSVAYSFYDLDGCTTPTTPKSELAFPNGKYTKVPVRALDGTRKRLDSDATIHLDVNSPEDLVRRGLEERGKGDLPKSAWYFMQAADSGSASGRMYWGLALRHGWGIARDEKRAYAELQKACEDSMAQGGLNFHGTPTAATLTAQQRNSLNKELAIGLFEVGNCFLNGVGVKKAPEVAISYLRFAANLGDAASQEQLGFLFSKGASGVKKDMKEAARWYRMAIEQGSSNIGLAWVFKDKYMD